MAFSEALPSALPGALLGTFLPGLVNRGDLKGGFGVKGIKSARETISVAQVGNWAVHAGRRASLEPIELKVIAPPSYRCVQQLS